MIHGSLWVCLLNWISPCSWINWLCCCCCSCWGHCWLDDPHCCCWYYGSESSSSNFCYFSCRPWSCSLTSWHCYFRSLHSWPYPDTEYIDKGYIWPVSPSECITTAQNIYKSKASSHWMANWSTQAISTWLISWYHFLRSTLIWVRSMASFIGLIVFILHVCWLCWRRVIGPRCWYSPRHCYCWYYYYYYCCCCRKLVVFW